MKQLRKYDIDNGATIAKLLPWFARGRALYDFLVGSSHTLVSTHQHFKTWAQEHIFKSILTSQTIVLEWYLNEAFGEYINDVSARIKIMNGILNQNALYYSGETERDDVYVYSKKEDKDVFFANNYAECYDIVYIYIPSLTGISYDEACQKIKQIIDKYKTKNFKYKIINNEI